MAKDKAVDAVIKGAMDKAEIRKALCTVTVSAVHYANRVFEGVAGYQLLDGNLVVLIHEGATYIVPMKDVLEICIEANKE